MFGFASPDGLDHQPKEDSPVKKPAKPHTIEARTGRPHMVGFARPAGPDHGPKEDLRIITKKGLTSLGGSLCLDNCPLWAVNSILAVQSSSARAFSCRRSYPLPHFPEA